VFLQLSKIKKLYGEEECGWGENIIEVAEEEEEKTIGFGL